MEGIYFQHDPGLHHADGDIKAELGVERFIIDDGWFKAATMIERHWVIGIWMRKIPKRSGTGSSTCANLGMEFGIWVGPDDKPRLGSLYRAHLIGYWQCRNITSQLAAISIR